jgi:hypothetical protein
VTVLVESKLTKLIGDVLISLRGFPGDGLTNATGIAVILLG